MTGISDCTFTDEPTFNVRDYGAIGDQKTDDRAALRRAFNAAALSRGGKVYFPSGVYCLRRGIRLDGFWRVRLWLKSLAGIE